MKPQIIRFQRHKRHYVTLKQLFCFRLDRKFKWLQKICFWILHKLDCHQDEASAITSTTEAFDASDFLHQLVTQQDNIQEFFNIRPKAILIGAKDFDEIVGCPNLQSVLTFNAVGYSDSGPGILNIPVTVIPWMDGILYVP